MNLRISKYIKNSIITNFFAIFIVLFILILGNQFFLVMKEGIDLNILFRDMILLMIYKSLRDIPLIMLVSLFTAILMTFSNFNKSSEAVIFSSAGIGYKQVINILMPLILIFFVVNIFFNSFITPFALKKANDIRIEAKDRPEYLHIAEKRFMNFNNSETIIYVDEQKPIDSDFGQFFSKIFIRSNNDNEFAIITAKDGEKFKDNQTSSILLKLNNGVLYKNILKNHLKPEITKFEEYLFLIHKLGKETKEYPVKNQQRSLYQLIAQKNTGYLSELASRILKPISVVVLGILAILISKNSGTRGNTNYSYVIGFTFLITYLLSINYVEKLFFEEVNLLILGLSLVHIFYIFTTFFRYYTNQRL